MRKLFLATLAFGAFGGAAVAADMPLKAPVPPPIAVYNWTGFYAGLNAGYGWGDASSINNPVDPASMIVFSNDNFPTSTFNSSFRQKGAIAGGQAGYNWQFSNRVVAGIEADLQFSDIRGRDFHQAFLDPATFLNNFSFNAITERHLEWFGTVRGRLGFLATPSLLLYGTGGLAFGDTTSRGDVILAPAGPSSIGVSIGGFLFGCATAPATPTSTCYTGSNRQTSVGWSAGLGGEWMFAKNWSAKLEWLHLDLPGSTVTLVSPSPPSTAGVSTVYTFNHQTYDIVRAGINYHFAAGPVVAKY